MKKKDSGRRLSLKTCLCIVTFAKCLDMKALLASKKNPNLKSENQKAHINKEALAEGNRKEIWTKKESLQSLSENNKANEWAVVARKKNKSTTALADGVSDVSAGNNNMNTAGGQQKPRISTTLASVVPDVSDAQQKNIKKAVEVTVDQEVRGGQELSLPGKVTEMVVMDKVGGQLTMPSQLPPLLSQHFSVTGIALTPFPKNKGSSASVPSNSMLEKVQNSSQLVLHEVSKDVQQQAKQSDPLDQTEINQPLDFVCRNAQKLGKNQQGNGCKRSEVPDKQGQSGKMITTIQIPPLDEGKQVQSQPFISKKSEEDSVASTVPPATASQNASVTEVTPDGWQKAGGGKMALPLDKGKMENLEKRQSLDGHVEPSLLSPGKDSGRSGLCVMEKTVAVEREKTKLSENKIQPSDHAIKIQPLDPSIDPNNAKSKLVSSVNYCGQLTATKKNLNSGGPQPLSSNQINLLDPSINYQPSDFIFKRKEDGSSGSKTWIGPGNLGFEFLQGPYPMQQPAGLDADKASPAAVSTADEASEMLQKKQGESKIEPLDCSIDSQPSDVPVMGCQMGLDKPSGSSNHNSVKGFGNLGFEFFKAPYTEDFKLAGPVVRRAARFLSNHG